MLQACEGYLEKGQVYPLSPLTGIQGRYRVIITILDEPIANNENAEAWQDFLQEINKIDDEPLSGFERVKFREVEI